MAGYIGSKSSVTQVDGYTEAEADAEFVNDPNGAITVSGSNVGIGTSPSAKLEVLSTYASDSTEQVRFRDNTGGSLDFYGYANATKAIQALDSSDNDNPKNLMLNPLGGNVGIGTTSPDAPLDVTRSGDGTIAVLQTTGNHGFEISAPSSTTLQIASKQGSKNLDLWANTLSFSAGGSQRMAIDSSGRVTMPYQPAFDAYRSSGSYNSGNTVTSMDLNSTRLNVGGHYNTASNSLRFTAPVGGVYQFNFRTIIRGAYNSGHVKMVKNGVDLQGTDTHFSPSVASEWSQVNIQIIVALNANDYMQVRFHSNTNIYGNSYESFNGHLIG